MDLRNVICPVCNSKMIHTTYTRKFCPYCGKEITDTYQPFLDYRGKFWAYYCPRCRKVVRNPKIITIYRLDCEYCDNRCEFTTEPIPPQFAQKFAQKEVKK